MDGALVEEVRRHSGALRKELSLTNLVLTQVVYIAGLSWLGAAAKLGSAHVFYWLPAAIFFYVPSAIVVIHLTGEMPLEGGLYQWAKLRWGPLLGFLTAWNLWLYGVLLLAELGIVTTNNLAYATGAAWIAEDKAISIAVSIGLVGFLALAALRGLAIGKWLHNVAGATLIVLFVAMLCFAVPRWLDGRATTAPAALAAPALTLFNLNILGKMSFGAFSGSEGVSVFAGEIRDPDAARAIRRSVWLAAPVVTAIFTVGTACMLASSRPEDLDLVSPVAQNLNAGARALGLGGSVVPAVMALMLLARFGTGSMAFNVSARLPMLAGWDHVLPPWFTRLHPRWRTPATAIGFVTIVVLAFAVAANLGVGSQEAFQLLQSGSGISYALTYVVMFSIPLAAPGPRAPWTVRVAAASGLAMTLLYVVLSIFPIVDVASGRSFTLKISAVVVGSNVLGAAFFLLRSRRLR